MMHYYFSLLNVIYTKTNTKSDMQICRLRLISQVTKAIEFCTIIQNRIIEDVLQKKKKHFIITNLIFCDFRQEGKYVYNMLRQMRLPGLLNAEIKIRNIKCKVRRKFSSAVLQRY